MLILTSAVLLSTGMLVFSGVGWQVGLVSMLMNWVIAGSTFLHWYKSKKSDSKPFYEDMDEGFRQGKWAKMIDLLIVFNFFQLVLISTSMVILPDFASGVLFVLLPMFFAAAVGKLIDFHDKAQHSKTDFRVVYLLQILKQIVVSIIFQVAFSAIFNWFMTGTLAVGTLLTMSKFNWEFVLGSVMLMLSIPYIFSQVNEIFEAGQVVRLYAGAALLFTAIAFLANLPGLYMYALLFFAFAGTYFSHTKAMGGGSLEKDVSCWQSTLLMALLGGRANWPRIVVGNLAALSSMSFSSGQSTEKVPSSKNRTDVELSQQRQYG